MTTDEAERVAKIWKTGYMETSAKTNYNVKEMFAELLQMEKRRNMTLNLDPKKSKNQRRRERLKAKCTLM